MSLGVLNNLNAISAENNLNNTSSSLSKVLGQLSSGSKINSGADDAAGLSLVNGLQANSQALTQSKINALEGVGLLQVADGALSQVTSLLNRAVTLATEASNGTLNSSQDTAANNEYQSILSEVTNIGSTTTYNGQAVFGSTTAIYTGDSTAAGASVNSLNIRSLSSSNLGDTNGVMSYATAGGNGSVFLSLGDTTAGTGSTTYNNAAVGVATAGSIVVNTLSASGGTVSTTITSADTTVGGLIKAINGSGLGITASLATDKVAGAGTTGNEGIMITGSVGAGTTPGASSFTGSVTANASTDVLSGSVTITSGSGAPQTITMAAVNKAMGGSKISDLEAYINADGALGATSSAASATMTLTSSGGASSKLQVSSSLYDTTTGTSLNYTSTSSYGVGIGATTNVTNMAVSAASAIAAAGTAGGTGGTATISYSDAAGQSLSSTSLSTQADAQAALTALNTAITDVAAQDGYIGAQINQLTAVGSVLSTQSANVTSAQNAVQATDYAQASSDMSKYEILSQTGISALAQANSVQQEVTKLLQ
jgi:flagellin